MSNIIWKYVKSLKEIKSISKIESENHIRLPESVVKLVIENNGGRPRPNCFDTKNTKEHIFKTLLSFNEDDKETVYKVLPIFKTEEVIKYFPIASDPFGNYICIDLNTENVVFWNHETDVYEFVSNEVSTLLNELYDID